MRKRGFGRGAIVLLALAGLFEFIAELDDTRGDYQTLLTSIRDQVFTLPDDTRLLNGHGPETTVGFEKAYNPFL